LIRIKARAAIHGTEMRARSEHYVRICLIDARFGALLLPGREPTMLAGDALVVVDSASA
jgi:hypothetical protein